MITIYGLIDLSNGYYLIIDAGTTTIKAFAYDDSGEIIKKVVNRVPVSFPRPGWVEQDPSLYWEKVFDSVKRICDELGRPLAVGITNQRATTVVWDKVDGEPLYNMITWQDTRAYDLAEELSKESLVRLGRFLGSLVEAFAKVFKRLGESKSAKYLITIAHFKFGSNQPGIHLRWLMDNVSEFAKAVKAGKAAFGTLDSWILWNMVGRHVTDFTNASATGIFDPFYLKWSDRLIKILGIPREILPSVVDNMCYLGKSKVALDAPVTAVIADQQASLYSAGGARRGAAKMTNGTGTFIDVNVGSEPVPAVGGTYPMVALKQGEKAVYLIEGIVQATGSAIDWLVDLGIIGSPAEADELAELAKDSFGVVFVPALAGIGTPYWINEVRGCVYGLSRGTRREHLVRALLEGLAFRLSEVISIVESVSGIRFGEIVADGNASRYDVLLQLVADLSSKKVIRVKNLEGSSRGAFLLARGAVKGLSVDEAWISPEVEKVFEPRADSGLNPGRWLKSLRSCINYYESLK
mgnify:CR=1 FL=1